MSLLSDRGLRFHAILESYPEFAGRTLHWSGRIVCWSLTDAVRMATIPTDTRWPWRTMAVARCRTSSSPMSLWKTPERIGVRLRLMTKNSRITNYWYSVNFRENLQMLRDDIIWRNNWIANRRCWKFKFKEAKSQILQEHVVGPPASVFFSVWPLVWLLMCAYKLRNSAHL